MKVFPNQNLSRRPDQNPLPQATICMTHPSWEMLSPSTLAQSVVQSLNSFTLAPWGRSEGCRGSAVIRAPHGVRLAALITYDLLHSALLIRSAVIITLNLVKHRMQVAECNVPNRLSPICSVTQHGPATQEKKHRLVTISWNSQKSKQCCCGHSSPAL